MKEKLRKTAALLLSLALGASLLSFTACGGNETPPDDGKNNEQTGGDKNGDQNGSSDKDNGDLELPEITLPSRLLR